MTRRDALLPGPRHHGGLPRVLVRRPHAPRAGPGRPALRAEGNHTVTTGAQPVMPCVCQRWGYDDATCVCEPAERWARCLIACKTGTPPLDDATRRRWASDIASVE